MREEDNGAKCHECSDRSICICLGEEVERIAGGLEGSDKAVQDAGFPGFGYKDVPQPLWRVCFFQIVGHWLHHVQSDTALPRKLLGMQAVVRDKETCRHGGHVDELVDPAEGDMHCLYYTYIYTHTHIYI